MEYRIKYTFLNLLTSLDPRGKKLSGKAKLTLCSLIFFKCLVCKATVVPDPYFSSLIKKYDVSNAGNLLKRITPKGEVHVSSPVPPEVDSFWQDLTPQMTPQLAQQINQYEKNMKNYSFNQNFEQQSDQLDKIKSGFMRHYLEKRVLNGFIIKRIKESSPGLNNVENQVKNLSGEGPVTKISKAKTSEPEDTWNIDVGTRTDWIRQRSRAWFNCSLFNSEARIDAAGFSRLNYELKISKSLVIDDATTAFSVFHTALVVNNEETSSLIKTNISRNLELNYQSVFSRADNIFQVNYNIEF